MVAESRDSDTPVSYCFSMAATTVKLEQPLLGEIQSVKPRDQTLAAYVREALERDLRRRKLTAAAHEYQAFLAAHPDEQKELNAWSEAPLVRPSRRRKR